MADRNETLGHADDADGIEEYDNALPDWWVGLFVLSIIAAAIYPIWFHGMGNTQVEFYEREMAAAEVLWPVSEQLAALPTDAATIALGEQTYQQMCSACHKADLTGGIGPSLIDEVWIHGSSGPEILATVTNGVKEKGMPAWGPILGPEKAAAAAAFILSRQGVAPILQEGEQKQPEPVPPTAP